MPTMGDWMDEKNKLNVFSAAGSLRDAALYQVQARKEKQEADALAQQLGFKRELVDQGLDFNGQPQYDRNDAANIAARAKEDALAANLGFKRDQMGQKNEQFDQTLGLKRELGGRGLDIRQQTADQQQQSNMARAQHNLTMEGIQRDLADGRIDQMKAQGLFQQAQMDHMQVQERISQGNLDERVRSNKAGEGMAAEKFGYGKQQDLIQNDIKQQGLQNQQDRTEIYRGYVEENTGRKMPRAAVPQVRPAAPQMGLPFQPQPAQEWQSQEPTGSEYENAPPPMMPPAQVQAQASADQQGVRVTAKQKLLAKGFSDEEAEQWLASKGM